MATNRQAWVSAATYGLLIVVALWLPFGLHEIGLVEEWSFLASLDRGDPVVAPPVLAGLSTRPLLLLPFALGRWLTPDSFVGLNALEGLLFFGKSLALFAVVAELSPGRPALAFLAGVLFMVYPADSALFGLRFSNMHLSVFAYLVAVVAMFRFAKRPRWITAIILCGGQILSLGGYEGGLPLMLASAALLVLVPGGHRGRAVAVWYVVPVASALLTALVLRGGQAVQSAFWKTRASGSFESFVAPLAGAYRRHFFEGWIEAAREGWMTPDSVVAVVVGALAALGALSIARSSRPADADRRTATHFRLMGAGLLMIGLGYLPFLFLPDPRVTERVFFYSSAGAAICVTSFLGLVAEMLPGCRREVLVAGAVLVAVASAGALGQHRRIARYSRQAERILAPVTVEISRSDPHPVVLLFDPDRTLHATHWLFGGRAASSHLADAVRYLRHDPTLQVFRCYPADGVWGASQESCQLLRRGVRLTWGGRAQALVPYRDVIAFEILADGSVVRLQALASGAGWQRWVASDEIREREVAIPTSASVDFQSAVPGGGWSGSWMSAPVSTLDLPLAGGLVYRVEFRVFGGLTPEIASSLSLRVNDRSIDLASRIEATGASIHRGRIAAEVIEDDPGLARLEFRVDRVVTPRSLGINEDVRTLGVRFDWLRIEAAPADDPAWAMEKGAEDR